ncbi:YojF family protein [Bacillus sp. PS06]|uniref:YojF family protein n=1 Tax=Bacillus sp. PS06 TaxID=2764176 RepID=UPI0017805F30|nr:YojF family protein [Bacillus sp. PS06]MBD8068027.1 YojF family protein [Bacillus sp. PS06]
MKSIIKEDVQQRLNELSKTELYLHLETTNGAYAAHHDSTKMNVGAYIRNTKLTVEMGKITGEGPYRVGLKTTLGWVYAEGLTDFHIDQEGRLLLAGHDAEGKLAVALQLSKNPF